MYLYIISSENPPDITTTPKMIALSLFVLVFVVLAYRALAMTKSQAIADANIPLEPEDLEPPHTRKSKEDPTTRHPTS